MPSPQAPAKSIDPHAVFPQLGSQDDPSHSMRAFNPYRLSFKAWSVNTSRSPACKWALILVIVAFSFVGHGQSFLTNGLVAHYPLDGNANDASGNGHHGVVYNATLTADHFGAENRAFHFNPTNGSVIVLPPLATPQGSSDRTYSFWMRMDAASPVFALGNTNLGGTNLQFSITAPIGTPIPAYGFAYAVKMLWQYPSGASDYKLSEQSTIQGQGGPRDLPNSGWHHYVIYAPRPEWSSMEVIIDGKGRSYNTYTKLDTSLLKNTFGPMYMGRWLRGSLSGLRIYNRRLSWDEAASLYGYEATGALVTARAVKLSAPVVPGRTYQLESSNDLISWLPSGDMVTATNPTFEVFVEMHAIPRFWRLAFVK